MLAKKKALPGVADRTGLDGNTIPCVYYIVTQGREKGKNNVKRQYKTKPPALSGLHKNYRVVGTSYDIRVSLSCQGKLSFS